MTAERYKQILSEWAQQEKESALQAKMQGDERQQSICLMKASMLGDMLTVLGVREIEGHRGVMERIARNCDAEAEKMRALGDFDAAERADIKAQTIRRAFALTDQK